MAPETCEDQPVHRRFYEKDGFRVMAETKVCGDDHPGRRPLSDGCNAFCGRSGPAALDERDTARTWGRFFDAAEDVHGLGASVFQLRR